MLLQRLIADPKSGFNYDYMGYAEFEFGATRKARIQLAKLQIEGKLTGQPARFFARWGNSTYGPADVFVFGSKEVIQKLVASPPAGTNVLGDLVINTDKSSAHLDNNTIVGWMSVHMNDPILIIRKTDENISRGNKFLQDFIDGILGEEKKADGKRVYHYKNGWTLKRVNGPVVLAKNNGIPIEGGGQWVLFDEDDQAIDRDKYFSDITESYYNRIGDPISHE